MKKTKENEMPKKISEKIDEVKNEIKKPVKKVIEKGKPLPEWFIDVQIRKKNLLPK